MRKWVALVLLVVLVGLVGNSVVAAGGRPTDETQIFRPEER